MNSIIFQIVDVDGTMVHYTITECTPTGVCRHVAGLAEAGDDIEVTELLDNHSPWKKTTKEKSSTEN